jgi:para-aminobenzoate synthetase component 1
VAGLGAPSRRSRLRDARNVALGAGGVKGERRARGAQGGATRIMSLTPGHRPPTLARVNGPVLPMVRGVRVEDPLAALRALADLPHPFLLHSSLEDERARWSFFGADPYAVHAGGDWNAACAAWRRGAAAMARDQQVATRVPFTGGAVGYWAYDFGRRLERVPSTATDDLGLPDFVLGLYDVVGAFDHERREAWLFSSGLPSADATERAARAARRLEEFTRRLEAPPEPRDAAPPRREPAHAVSGFTPDAYRAAVERVRDHIVRGDIFQANLSQRWRLAHGEPDMMGLALRLNEALARRSPAPYAAFLGARGHAVVSASPECFLTLRGRAIETRPIKGTRPRRGDPIADARELAALAASAKDRAENVMIVDVLRNDLGRVSVTGTVRVRELCALETFAQVHHLVSTVTGELEPGDDAFGLLEACFPGGSITGAPKIRAMQILEALEPVRRHVYTGAIGYVDWRGDADWNIAIRTAVITPEAVCFSAGGGITADSDPQAEYEETLHKAEGMRLALTDTVGPVALEPAEVTA